MTKVIKFPEKHRLQIEISGWDFNNLNRSLDISYVKDGQEKELHLSKEQLLDYLDRSFIIDSYKGEEVSFGSVHDFFDAAQADGHGQREYADRMNIVAFMNEMLSEEEV